MPYDVDHEVKLVQYYIAKVGKKQDDGTYKCTFEDIFKDEEAEQIFESLPQSKELMVNNIIGANKKVGSLKAARRYNVLKFDGQMLLMPTHKDVVLHLVEPLPEGTYVEPPKPVKDQ